MWRLSHTRKRESGRMQKEEEEEENDSLLDVSRQFDEKRSCSFPSPAGLRACTLSSAQHEQ